MVRELGRECKSCGQYFLWEFFNRNSHGKNGHYSNCKTCSRQKAVQRYHEKDKFTYLLRTYGLTKDQFLLMYEAQDKRCAICQNEIFPQQNNGPDQLAVDHCHETGHVRGLLCNHCNRGLGMFKENKTSLQNAIKYLEKADG